MGKALIKNIGKAAVELYNKYKILPSLTIAQAIVESGWGKSDLSESCHNYFGMKWCEGCGCDYKVYKTAEQRADGSYYTVSARFRKYATLADGIEGYYKFLQYPRYKNLVGVTDYKKACKLIRQDGWATALSYSELLVAVIEENNLTKYDKQALKAVKTAPKKPKVTKPSFKIGDRVKVNGKIYCNGDGSGGSLKKKKETMYVVDIVDKCRYKYYIGVGATALSARQGWGDAKTVKKAK